MARSCKCFRHGHLTRFLLEGRAACISSAMIVYVHSELLSQDILWDELQWCPRTALARWAPTMNGLARLHWESGARGKV